MSTTGAGGTSGASRTVVLAVVLGVASGITPTSLVGRAVRCIAAAVITLVTVTPGIGFATPCRTARTRFGAGPAFGIIEIIATVLLVTAAAAATTSGKAAGLFLAAEAIIAIGMVATE